MKFLLDTNAWIKVLNRSSSAVKNNLASKHPKEIVLCSVVKFELYYGAFNSTRIKENLELLTTLFKQFESLTFTDEIAELCGKIRAEFHKNGKPIGPYDLQIAGIALANNLILVTHNKKEFSRIEGLKIEDWE